MNFLKVCGNIPIDDSTLLSVKFWLINLITLF